MLIRMVMGLKLSVVAASAFFICSVGYITSEAATVTNPVVSSDVRHDVSVPLYLTPPPKKTVQIIQPQFLKRIEVPNRIPPVSIPPYLPGFQDPALQRPSGKKKYQSAVAANNVPVVSVNFEGISNLADNGPVTGFIFTPPDTNGDVGPNHYVQMTNSVFKIWSKAGTLLFGAAANNSIWAGFGGLCQSTNRGDPIVLYDDVARRWMISQFAFNKTAAGRPIGPYHECIAISKTADPTGAWFRYDFLTHNTKFDDFPKLGIWPDGYYMSVNQFDDLTGGAFAGVGVAAFERSKMLTGQPARMVYFDLAISAPALASILPAHADSSSMQPPVGAPNYFLHSAANQLEIWQFHVDWLNPNNSSFTGPTVLPTAPFSSALCASFRGQCIDQPVTAVKLEYMAGRPMNRFQYRNFGNHEAMVVNQTVNVAAGRAGIRWYELRKTGASWAIAQQSTFSPDADHRWMGSIAMDAVGDMALGYSVSSTVTNPSIRYTGRLATDPINTLQPEATIITGGRYQTSSSRWGDYSAMSVDPSDDCTFWYTQEYYAIPESIAKPIPWQTRIASFKFPGCRAKSILPNDFNGDRKSDILFRQILTGRNYMMLMNGRRILRQGLVRGMATSWTVVGNGDYNGDGNSDILFHQTSTGWNFIRLMSGRTVLRQGGVRRLGPSWSIVGNGDYNGDGKSDILLRQASTGLNYMMLMNGLVVLSEGRVRRMGVAWSVVGSGDYNGDGKSDILFHQNSTGRNYIRFMNGLTVIGQGGFRRLAPSWSIVGSGDYNGDGNSDVLFRQASTGLNFIRLMNGLAVVRQGRVRRMGVAWSVVGSGDYNGDGKSDILFHQNSTGRNYMRFMNGLAVLGQGGVRRMAAAWTVINTD